VFEHDLTERGTSGETRTCSSQIGSTIQPQKRPGFRISSRITIVNDARQVTHRRAHRDHPLRPNPNTRLQYHRGRPPRNPNQNQPSCLFVSTEPLPPRYSLLFPLSQLGHSQNLETSKTSSLTILRPRLEIQHLVLLWNEQPIVRPVPVLILWVRMRVVRQASESFVTPDGGQVSADGVDDVVDSLPSESQGRSREREQVIQAARSVGGRN
jgi:hypothetical protein